MRNIRLLSTVLLTTLAASLELSTDAKAQEIPPPLPLCGPRTVALMSDFEDGEAASAEAWAGLYIFNDGTGVQLPADPLDVVVEGGPGRSRFMAYTVGDDFTEWGSGLGMTLGCAYDVRRFEGVRFAVQAGGAGSFRFEVLTLPTTPVEFGGECAEGCNDHYSETFSLPKEEWYECSVRFADLAQVGFGAPVPLDLSSVHGVQYNFTLDDMPFDLAVDEISFEKKVKKTGCVRLQTDNSCGGKKHKHRQKRGPKLR